MFGLFNQRTFCMHGHHYRSSVDILICSQQYFTLHNDLMLLEIDSLSLSIYVCISKGCLRRVNVI